MPPLSNAHQQDERRGLAPRRDAKTDKVERILARLDEATEPGHMDLPGFRLHPLKGDLTGFWSVSVSGNWRIVFRFKGANAYDIDLADYH